MYKWVDTQPANLKVILNWRQKIVDQVKVKLLS